MRVEDDHHEAEEVMNPPGEAGESASGVSGMSTGGQVALAGPSRI